MRKYLLWSFVGLIGAVAIGAAGFFGFLYAVEKLNEKEAVVRTEEPKKEKKKYNPPNAEEVFDLVNQERERVGVQPLIKDTRLIASAEFKASDMKSRDYFSHADPETGMENGLDKIDELTAGSCSYVGENIQRNGLENTSEAAFDSWKKSPAHYEAMISADYTYAGVGVAGIYVVQHFCY